MIHVSIPLSDDIAFALDAKVRGSGHADRVDYLRTVIEDHLSVVADWEMTPELAAALEEGERSGVSPYSFDEIIAKAKREAGLR